MSLHYSTFDYLQPTEHQTNTMNELRKATSEYAAKINYYLPDGPDKDYILRKLRELSMWNNVAITREADGSPRS